MKKSILIIIISILSITISPQLYAKEPLLILNDTNKAPFTTKNKDGFLDIILENIFQRIGFKVSTVRLPPERGLLSANDGTVDGEVNRIKGLDKIYTNLIRVPEVMRASEFCALSKNPNIVNTSESLKKQVVGHVKGWKIYDKMMQGSSNVITAVNPQQLFQLLKINRIDVALYSCAEGAELVKRMNMTDIKILKPVFEQTGLYLYLNKRHASLVPRLSKALREIKDEGLYEKLYREKIQPYYDHLN